MPNYITPPIEHDDVKSLFEQLHQSEYLSDDIKIVWETLYDTFETAENNGQNNKILIISSYVLIPNILLFSFRELMLYYFEKIGIDKSILIDGKWMHDQLNIKSTLINHILTTQKIHIDNIEHYIVAIDYFTKENTKLHRNKAAHNIVDAYNAANHVTLHDCKNKMLDVLRFILSLEKYIANLPN